MTCCDAYPVPGIDDDDLVDRNCRCCSQCCHINAYARFRKAQDFVYIIVSDFAFEIFITVVIVLNVLSMAVAFYGQPDEMSTVLDTFNYVRVLQIYCYEIVLIFYIKLGKIYYYISTSIKV